MSNSKWNRVESVPISSLNEAQLKEAVHEWAEGSEAMERLLWSCLNNGVVTDGCDAGNHGHFPYLSVVINESRREMVEKIIAATLKCRCAKVIFHFHGNPRSGPDWYKESVGVFLNTKGDETECFFKEISNVLEADKKHEDTEVAKSLMKLCDFLQEKCSPIDFRVNSYKSGHELVLRCFGFERYWSYFNELFTKANLVKENNSENVPFAGWTVKCSDETELTKAVDFVLEVIRNEWNFEIPTELSDGEWRTNYGAKLMRMKFGTDEHGVKLMNNWLNANKPEGMHDVNY